MRDFMRSMSAKVGAGFGAVMAVVLLGANVAHADTITDAFTTAQTSLAAYIVAGVGVIVAIVGLGLGVTVLVKYLRKAARAA